MPRRLSDDELADLILHVSDLLDPVAPDPLVTVIRVGDGLRVHVRFGEWEVSADYGLPQSHSIPQQHLHSPG